jgi:CMP/dCMP kinase
MSTAPIVIAVDGPSAGGKGSISKAVARRLGFIHVDTGAMYRALTHHCQQHGWIPRDTAGREFNGAEASAVAAACDSWPVELVDDAGVVQVRLEGRVLSEELRAPEVAAYVARVSHVPRVREWMLGFQRGCARFGNLVMDGRDIGSRIFPETPFKFYIHARPEVREQRGGNSGHGGAVGLRDAIDSDLNQAVGDAEIVDTSDITIEQAVARVLESIARKKAISDQLSAVSRQQSEIRNPKS